jgi:hypothetical protein
MERTALSVMCDIIIFCHKTYGDCGEVEMRSGVRFAMQIHRPLLNASSHHVIILPAVAQAV